MRKIRFATWNLNNRKRTDKHALFLRKINPDVIAFQETSRNFHQQLLSEKLFRWGHISTAPPLNTRRSPRALHCSIAGNLPAQILDTYSLMELPFPERSLCVKAAIDNHEIQFCSFHVPPGASWKQLKPQSMCTIDQYLRTQTTTTLVGIDANSPKLDHLLWENNTWWWPEEPLLLGHNRQHPLNDALRLYLDQFPHELQRIKAGYPNGPLATTYIRGNGKLKTPCRYDHIYISPHIRVTAIDHVYEEAVAAESDHALVIAELEIPSAYHDAIVKSNS